MLFQCRDLTPPIDSEEELEEARVLEGRARKELEEDGCPPCYPAELDLPLETSPEEYKAIVRYWKSVDDVVLCYQKLDWEKFRMLQARVRRRNRSFSDFVDEVRQRRATHGLGGHVCLLLDIEQQSRLDNWIEFQNRHLKRLERFERERAMLKQELDDAQKLVGGWNTTCPKLGPTRAEALERRLEATERDLKRHHVLLNWIEQRRLAMDPGHAPPVEEGYKDLDAPSRVAPRTSTRGRQTKQTEGPSVLGKVRIAKAKPNEWSTRHARMQKPKASEFEPPFSTLDVILQSGTSQASEHSESTPRRTKIDRTLHSIYPQSVSKPCRFAGIRAKMPSGPRRRGAQQTEDHACRPTQQRAQSAPTFTTRSGRVSRLPTR